MPVTADVNIDTEIGDALATTTLASTRVYPVARPQGAGYPCISWTRISEPRIQSLNRTVVETNTRFQVDCWAVSATAAFRLRREAMTAVLAYHGVAIGVYSLTIEDARDIHNPETDVFNASFDIVVTT